MIKGLGLSNILSILSLLIGFIGLLYSRSASVKAQEAALAIEETKKEIRFRDIISELELFKSKMLSSIQEYQGQDIKSCRIYVEESCELYNKLENYPAIQDERITDNYYNLKEDLTNIRSYIFRLENEGSPLNDQPFYHDEIRKYTDEIDKWISMLRNG